MQLALFRTVSVSEYKNKYFYIYIFLKVASLFPYSAFLEAIDLCVWITNKQNKRANYKVKGTDKHYKVVLRVRNLWLSLRPKPTLYYYAINADAS